MPFAALTLLCALVLLAVRLRAALSNLSFLLSLPLLLMLAAVDAAFPPSSPLPSLSLLSSLCRSLAF